MIDRDTTVAERLVTEGAAASLCTPTAADVSTARRVVDHEHPDIVLFDPSFSDVAAEGLTLLAELAGRIPPCADSDGSQYFSYIESKLRGWVGN